MGTSDLYYAAYLKDNPAQEPIAVGQSAPGVLADASRKIGRPKSDFELLEITREQFERLKQFLA
jgi:hypothetical protein